MSAEAPGRVVLLHGIARSAWSMAPVARALRRAGFEVLNLTYPSTRESLAGIAATIHPPVAAFASRDAGAPLHFVTHSMGGLVARVYLDQYPARQAGRIVMLAPPNGGSELADRHAGRLWYRLALGPAGAELTTARAENLPVPGAAIGVIAGTRSIYPLGRRHIPGPNDGRVSLARTRLPAWASPEADWIAVPAPHPFIMRHPVAIAATLRFLETGRF